MRLCACRGPQNGNPLCPCKMRGVRRVGGRLVKVVDLGPDPDPERARMEAWMDRFRKNARNGVINGICQPYGPGHRLHR